MSQSTVTIEGGHTRRVLTCALWRIISEGVIGAEDLSDACFSAGWRSIHASYALDEEPAEAEYRLARIEILRSTIRAVARAELGAELALPVPAGELEDALVDCVRAIDQNDELLAGLSPDEHADVIACRDAAVRLLRSIRRSAAAAEVAALAASQAVYGLSVPEFEGTFRALRLRDGGGTRSPLPLA